MKYIIWRTLFRLTPAGWICEGCNFHLYNQAWRFRWGRFVTEKYGECNEPTEAKSASDYEDERVQGFLKAIKQEES